MQQQQICVCLCKYYYKLLFLILHSQVRLTRPVYIWPLAIYLLSLQLCAMIFSPILLTGVITRMHQLAVLIVFSKSNLAPKQHTINGIVKQLYINSQPYNTDSFCIGAASTVKQANKLDTIVQQYTGISMQLSKV